MMFCEVDYDYRRIEIKKEGNASVLGIQYKIKSFKDGDFLLMMTTDGTQYHFLNVKKFNFIYHALLTMILIRLREVCRLTAKIL